MSFHCCAMQKKKKRKQTHANYRTAFNCTEHPCMGDVRENVLWSSLPQVISCCVWRDDFGVNFSCCMFLELLMPSLHLIPYLSIPFFSQSFKACQCQEKTEGLLRKHEGDGWSVCLSVSVRRDTGLEKWDLVSGQSSEWAPDLDLMAPLLAALSMYRCSFKQQLKRFT